MLLEVYWKLMTTVTATVCPAVTGTGVKLPVRVTPPMPTLPLSRQAVVVLGAVQG
jgi:hypothetical protein